MMTVLARYDEAVRRLVQFRADPTCSDETYAACLEIVADINWTNEARVRADVRKAAGEIEVL